MKIRIYSILRTVSVFIILIFGISKFSELSAQDSGFQGQVSESQVSEIAEEINLETVVYYFYGTRRCRTCRIIEGYTKEALDRNFKQDMEDGKVQYKPVNVDVAGGEEYVKKYQLVTRSVVVSYLVDGKEVNWKRLDDVWRYYSNQDAFIHYVTSEVKQIKG